MEIKQEKRAGKQVCKVTFCEKFFIGFFCCHFFEDDFLL
jgi:hypothetical protein